MTHRAEQLHSSADQQISELIELLSTVDDATMHRPCPGREKLGDGTIGAIASHTAENYERIATFLATSQRMSTRHENGVPGRHRIPGVMRALGHTTSDRGQHGQGGHGHDIGYTAESASPREIIQRLEAARDQLIRVIGLTDQQLDAVPPKDSFRFCDGQRTLEQVLGGLLKHQHHQAQTIEIALGSTP